MQYGAFIKNIITYYIPGNSLILHNGFPQGILGYRMSFGQNNIASEGQPKPHCRLGHGIHGRILVVREERCTDTFIS